MNTRTGTRMGTTYEHEYEHEYDLMNVSSIAPSQSPQACPQALPPLRRGGWGVVHFSRRAALGHRGRRSHANHSKLAHKPSPLFKGGPGGGVMKIIRPTASEMPPVLFATTACASAPHPNPPPQGTHRGEGISSGLRREEVQQKPPRAQRRSSAAIRTTFSPPQLGGPALRSPPLCDERRGRRSRANHRKPAHKPSPPYEGGAGGVAHFSRPRRAYPACTVVNPASLILIGFSRCRDGPALVCNR